MGVDFYTCQNEACSYNFPDCGRYFTCTSCEAMFCSDKCGGKEYILDADGNQKESSEWGGYECTCIICRKESVPYHSMVRFLLKKLGLTYDQALLMYKEEPKE